MKPLLFIILFWTAASKTSSCPMQSGFITSASPIQSSEPSKTRRKSESLQPELQCPISTPPSSHQRIYVAKCDKKEGDFKRNVNSSPEQQPSLEDSAKINAPIPPPAPTVSGVVPACAKWYTIPASADITCDDVRAKGDIGMSLFQALNPNVSSECDNLRPGYAYCIAGGSWAHINSSLSIADASLTGTEDASSTRTAAVESTGPPSSASASASASTTDISPSSLSRSENMISSTHSASTSKSTSTSTADATYLSHTSNTLRTSSSPSASTPTSPSTTPTRLPSIPINEPKALRNGKPNPVIAAVRPIRIPNHTAPKDLDAKSVSAAIKQQVPNAISSKTTQKSTDAASWEFSSSILAYFQTRSTNAVPTSSMVNAVVSPSTKPAETTAQNGLPVPSEVVPDRDGKIPNSDSKSTSGSGTTVRTSRRDFGDETNA